MTYQETRLANGLMVMSEMIPSVESVSVGAYVNAGARYENLQNNGVAHFLEHMAFKGTKKRSAEQIAREIEDVGGSMNAYTGRETTAYHLKLLKENLPLGVDILGDILTHSTFIDEEMDRERGVILQEIGMTLDTPDDMVFEHLQDISYPDQPVGRSILGTNQNVQDMTQDDLRAFMTNHYTPKNMVVSAAGNVDHQQLVDLVEKSFADLGDVTAPDSALATYHPGKIITEKDIEQVHVALSWSGLSILDQEYYASGLWAVTLGGGMASRLFQEVREKRGLAYTVYAYRSAYMDTGTMGIYAATDKKDVVELLNVLDTEVRNAQSTITQAELDRAKAQFKSGLRMSQEYTDARMEHMARSHFVYGRFVTLGETISDIDCVTLERTMAAGKRITQPDSLALSILGPVAGLSL